MLTSITDAPPAYSVAVSHSKKVDDESDLAFLNKYDTVFVVDDSSSMTSGTRWTDAGRALSAIAPICTERDSDGIDVYFINHMSSTPDNKVPEGKGAGGYYGLQTSADVQNVFRVRGQPAGMTDTGRRLSTILRPYVASLEKAGIDNIDRMKPVNIIVITDGEASDEVDQHIIKWARKLDAYDAPPDQVGIQFFQIGDDPKATEDLERLDDGLEKEEGVRDMVDTCQWDEEIFRNPKKMLKVVGGGVLKRLDKASAKKLKGKR